MQQGEYTNGATRRSFEGEVVDELKTQLEEVLQQNRDLAIRPTNFGLGNIFTLNCDADG